MGTATYDQSILEALRGYAGESSKNPKPRLVKIYISSTKHGKGMWNWVVGNFKKHLLYFFDTSEFKEERKVLLEVVGPELQSIYDDRQIEVVWVVLLDCHRIFILFYCLVSADWICWYAFWNWDHSHDNRLRSLCHFRSSKRDKKLLESI